MQILDEAYKNKHAFVNIIDLSTRIENIKIGDVFKSVVVGLLHRTIIRESIVLSLRPVSFAMRQEWEEHKGKYPIGENVLINKVVSNNRSDAKPIYAYFEERRLFESVLVNIEGLENLQNLSFYWRVSKK